MWPFIPSSEIDWQATGVVLQGLGTILAFVGTVAALLWSVRSTREARRRDALMQLAIHEKAWVDEFRSKVANVSNELNMLRISQTEDWELAKPKLSKALHTVGYLDLMFPGTSKDTELQFAITVETLRNLVQAQGAEFSETNTRLRALANEIIAERNSLIEGYIAGAEPKRSEKGRLS